MKSNLLIYGAYGYTGQLIARLARDRGLTPVLAGRNGERVRSLSDELGMEARVFDLAASAEHLQDIDTVLHCAGPFVHTAEPMVDACIARGAHYLDITGEIEAIRAVEERDEAAKAANVVLMPAVGVDVVPSDCLAAHLKARLPDASSLALAACGMGRVSHGTANTVVENLGGTGVVLQDGKATLVPVAHKTRDIDFGRGPRHAATVPLGDIATAFRSTGIGNVECYLAMPATARWGARLAGHIGWLLQSSAAQAVLKGLVKRQPVGPSDQERARGFMVFWGEASNDKGDRVVSRCRIPEGYTFTADAALTIATRVQAGAVSAGFHTPSTAMGADFVVELEGVERIDVETSGQPGQQR